MLRGKLGRLLRITRQQREECVESIGVKQEIRRKLPENRPQLLLQRQQPLREKIRQRDFDFLESLQVGNEFSALQGKDEVIGRLLIPLHPACWPLKRVERAVDFDGVQLARCV